MKYSTKDLYLARLGKVTSIKFLSYDHYRTYYDKLNRFIFARKDGLYYYDIFTGTEYRDLSHLNDEGDIIIVEKTPISINQKKVSKETLEKIVAECNPNVLIIKESPLQSIKQRLLRK